MASRALASGAAMVVLLGMLGPAEGQSRPAAGTTIDTRREQPPANHPGLATIDPTGPAEVAQWDKRIAAMIQSGDLRLRERVDDTLVAGRSHERYTQLYKGVPVVGGDVTRQVQNHATVSVSGSVYGGITIDATPKLTVEDAATVFQTLSGTTLGPSRAPELMVLPTDDGSYRLTYRARITTADEVVMTFVDAATGETVLSVSDLKRPVP